MRFEAYLQKLVKATCQTISTFHIILLLPHIISIYLHGTNTVIVADSLGAYLLSVNEKESEAQRGIEPVTPQIPNHRATHN